LEERGIRMAIDKRLVRDLIVLTPIILIAVALFYFLFRSGELHLFLIETAIFGGISLLLYLLFGKWIL
jgi:hypothetical protein